MTLKLSDVQGLPAGALLNENKKSGYIQVYKYEYEIDEETGSKKRIRISLGNVVRNRFVPSPQYQLRLDLERLEAENKLLKQKLSGTIIPPVEVAGQAAAVGASVSKAVQKAKLSGTKKTSVDVTALATVALFSALARVMLYLSNSTQKLTASSFTKQCLNLS